MKVVLEAKQEATILVLSGKPIARADCPLRSVCDEHTRCRDYPGRAGLPSGKDGTFVMTAPVLTIEGLFRRGLSLVLCREATVGAGAGIDGQTGRCSGVLAPFQLNPTMPKAGMDRRVYLKAKFRRSGEMQAIQDRIAGAGVSAGSSSPSTVCSHAETTLDAHRLIWFAQQQGRQDAAMEELFHGYFTDGLNIGADEVLVSLTARAGLDGAAVGRFLQSQDGVEAVRQEEARGRQLGIRGVPYFLLNGKPWCPVRSRSRPSSRPSEHTTR